ncbi:hypothetical protein [Anaerotignum sp.]
MTTEEKLKDYILSHYKSVHEFTQSIDMPYGTMASIFKRGIANSSVTNIIKICSALEISTDELAQGKIVPIIKTTSTKVEDIIEKIKYEISNSVDLTIDDEPVDEKSKQDILISLDMIIEFEKRKRMVNI